MEDAGGQKPWAGWAHQGLQVNTSSRQTEKGHLHGRRSLKERPSLRLQERQLRRRVSRKHEQEDGSLSFPQQMSATSE